MAKRPFPDNGSQPRETEQTKDLRNFSNLAEIARLINSSNDLPAVLNRIVSAVCQHSSWASCGIMGVNRKSGLSELVVRFDPRLDPATNPPTSWKLEQSATMRVIETNKLVIIPDAQICDEFLAYRDDALLRGYHTVVVLPLGTTDTLGREMTIAMHSREVVGVTGADLAFLSMVTQLASIAVEKAKRVQAERERTLSLRRAIEISTELMDNVLAAPSIEAIIGMVAAVVPYPLIIADLSTGTIDARRSPASKTLSESEWKRIAAGLGPTIVEMVRKAGATGQKTGHVLAVGIPGVAELRPVIEPLHVNGEIAGGLIIFPPAEVDDFDDVLVHAARLALNVQLMRDYVRFRSEADSVAEVFKALFAGSLQQRSELLARARRLGVSLDRPARLVKIGFPAESAEAAESLIEGLQLALARRVAELLPGAAVIRDDDIIIFAPAPVEKSDSAARWQKILRQITAVVENKVGLRPIIAASSLCAQMMDYREARLECDRVLALARMFGKTGAAAQADFGPHALLLSTIDHASARAFVHTALGAIEDYDHKHRTELLPTIGEFLRGGCRYQACANRLGIHVSTLRYRLGRLHDLFGIKLEERDSMFGLALALRLRELEKDAPLPRRPGAARQRVSTPRTVLRAISAPRRDLARP
jgi:purine catabolism regulator